VDPTFFDPKSLLDVSASRHVDLISYLDGLRKIPCIRAGGERLNAHIDSLMTLTVCGPRAPGFAFDLAAARDFARTMRLIEPGWKSFLSVRSKNLSFHYLEFVTRGPYYRTAYDIEVFTDMSTVESLYLWTGPHANRRVTDTNSTIIRGFSLYDRLYIRHGPPGRARCYGKLKRLVLRLHLPKRETLCVYEGGRMRNLCHLTSLRELAITMEGLLGSTRNLAQLFPGCPTFIPVDERDNPEDFTETETLEEIICGLPKTLETLSIMEWWHEYYSPVKLLPIEGRADASDSSGPPRQDYENDENCIKRLKALQKAALATLVELAPALAKDSKVKKVFFVVFRWKDKDAESLMQDLLNSPRKAASDPEADPRRPMCDLKQNTWLSFIAEVYKAHGIEFAVQ